MMHRVIPTPMTRAALFSDRGCRAPLRDPALFPVDTGSLWRMWPEWDSGLDHRPVPTRRSWREFRALTCGFNLRGKFPRRSPAFSCQVLWSGRTVTTTSSTYTAVVIPSSLTEVPGFAHTFRLVIHSKCTPPRVSVKRARSDPRGDPRCTVRTAGRPTPG